MYTITIQLETNGMDNRDIAKFNASPDMVILLLQQALVLKDARDGGEEISDVIEHRAKKASIKEKTKKSTPPPHIKKGKEGTHTAEIVNLLKGQHSVQDIMKRIPGVSASTIYQVKYKMKKGEVETSPTFGADIPSDDI